MPELLESRRMCLSLFCAMYWHEGEWEPDGRNLATIWEPIAFDAPADAHPHFGYDSVTFYDRTGNKRLGEVKVHSPLSVGTPLLLYVGDRDTGVWYDVGGCRSVVYRPSHRRWFVRWSGAKNTRAARAANAMMIAWRNDRSDPIPTVAELAMRIEEARG